jgi:hypothetical protein
VSHPNDRSLSNRFNVPIGELSKPKYEDYEIFDIGDQTVKQYVKKINTGHYDWRECGPICGPLEHNKKGDYLMYFLMCDGVACGGGSSIIVLKPGSELMTWGIMLARMAIVP